MRSLFDVCVNNDHLGNFKPLAAAFPMLKATVVLIGDGGEKQLVTMEWGLATPKISKRRGKSISPNALNNARDENL